MKSKIETFMTACAFVFLIVWMVLLAWELFSIGTGGLVPFFRPASWGSVGNSFLVCVACILHLEIYA